ncbi:DcaP family trimeric outer membrane transporter [Gilvimarinus algae]|uniref:DcaP family trimeric outer membrane transporter n=1 Tax=Gilvimarinus algae TaxID=3058037 RepID=A0ABT8THI6_9GAMM|nr:DcaP family trimeric outer membrane transporter [Gilvimarinus sp. SDUM040014]MDO3383475.1 DcaP family trimeric outer membrane transporter [Gilvimarinus sp. SDUM040014]
MSVSSGCAVGQSRKLWALAGFLCIAGAHTARSDELADLRRELEQTRAKLTSLEARIERAERAALEAEGDKAQAGGEKNFTVYGFTQLDYIQDFERSHPDWESTLRPSRIPTTEGLYGSDGQASLSVRQSRLGVVANLPVADDSIKTVFEFDLFGAGADEGQTTIRVRHAYGQWKSVLAGQTNSLFMDGDVFPNVIDYWGPAGMVFLRNPQIRWTPISGSQSFAVALEKPGTDVDSGLLGAVGFNLQGKQPLPDLTAQYRLTGERGHFQVAGILRDLAYENIGSADSEPSGEDLGWGVNLSSSYKLGAQTLRTSVVYGEGIATYMNDGGMDMAPDSYEASDLEAVPLLGVVAYLEHRWSERLSNAAGYSFTQVDNYALQLNGAFEKGEYASMNLLYAPSDKLLMGAEYLWGQRTDFGGASGTDNRLQFSVKYSFSSSDF